MEKDTLYNELLKLIPVFTGRNSTMVYYDNGIKVWINRVTKDITIYCNDTEGKAAEMVMSDWSKYVFCKGLGLVD